MKTSRLLVAVAALTTSGCVIEKSLVDEPGGPGSTSSAGSSSSPGNEGPGASGGQEGGETMIATTADVDDGEVDDSNGVSTAPGNDTGPGENCGDFTPPPIECLEAGDANAAVFGDLLFDTPPEDVPCLLLSVDDLNPTTQRLTVRCDDTLVLDVTTESPHLPFPLAEGETVRLTASQGPDFAVDTLASSFTLRDDGGNLLMAWVYEYDWEHDLASSVDLDPVVYTIGLTGCPGFNVAETCDLDGSIAAQRVQVEFGNGESPVIVSEGNTGLVDASGAPFDAIVARAERIACVDDDCAGDDSGPFETIQMLLMAAP